MNDGRTQTSGRSQASGTMLMYVHDVYLCMMCICACMRTVFSAESENLASLKWQCLKTSEKLSFLYAKCKLLLECVHILWFLEG